MVIGANELKTKGVGILSSMLQSLDEVLISVRGKNTYVVVDIERYEYLRECELEHAYRQVQADIASGNTQTMTVKEHQKMVEDALRD